MKSEAETKEYLLEMLRGVPDPEIPVINVIEMGIVRHVNREDGVWVIQITPTYSGCPAMHAIEKDIHTAMENADVGAFKIETILAPAWTTDWITDEAREKLRKYGIAPPVRGTADKGALHPIQKIVACPRCKSSDTRLVSQFGSTACKALYQCNECKEPFDYFKCI